MFSLAGPAYGIEVAHNGLEYEGSVFRDANYAADSTMIVLKIEEGAR